MDTAIVSLIKIIQKYLQLGNPLVVCLVNDVQRHVMSILVFFSCMYCGGGESV